MVPLEGPVSVGASVDGLLLGCALVQSCIYYRNAKDDPRLLKTLLSLILLLMLSHLGCLATWIWTASKVNNNDASEPAYAAILFGISNILGIIVLFFQRCFFSTRILKTSKANLLGFVFFTLCIFTFTVALGTSTIFFSNATTNSTTQLSASWGFPLSIISGSVCDLTLSATMVFYLKKQTPSENVDRMGWPCRLAFVIAETGFATSLIDVVAVVTYWLTRTNDTWVGILVMMPGVFVNVFVAALNARGRLVADIEHQRTVGLGGKFVDKKVKKSPILITISKHVEDDYSAK